MKRHIQMGSIGLLLGILLGAYGCAAGEDGREPPGESSGSSPAPQETAVAGSARELIAFFEEGGTTVQLSADIDLGDEMLRLEPGRGALTIRGKGHTISGDAPCIIRLAEGCSLRMERLQLRAEETGIGCLAGGELYAADCAIEARGNAIQAVQALRLLPGSSLSLTSREGAGILCMGLALGEGSTLQAKGDLFAISAGRGDILLEAGAQAECEASGDNAVKTDGALELLEGSRFAARNAGEHNAAKVGSLEAQPGATLELTGGENGVGLFIVEQYMDMTVQGFCRPEPKVEAGKGTVTFINQE